MIVTTLSGAASATPADWFAYSQFYCDTGGYNVREQPVVATEDAGGAVATATGAATVAC